MSIPTPYNGAHLDADTRAMLALAWAVWHRLSKTQQGAILGSCKTSIGLCLPFDTPMRTARALERAAVCCFDASGHHRLTGLGIMVREAGALTPGAGK